MNDAEAYLEFKDHRKWFNKLWLTEELGYNCGPSGIAPNKSGYYIVRPIMNISGMGAGAEKIYIDSGDISKTPPGYFWTEWFDGEQYSVNFEWSKYWKQTSCWKAERDVENLYKFKKWTRHNNTIFNLGSLFNDINVQKITKINVEFIEHLPIEVHLRQSPDPDYDEIVPIWSGDENLVDIYRKLGYNYIIDHDDADGFIKQKRLGFMVKNFQKIKRRRYAN